MTSKARLLAVCLLSAGLTLGCSGASRGKYGGEARLERGLILVLPGIEGPGPLSSSILDGLIDAGADQAVIVYRWGRPVPVAGMVMNEVDFVGNHAAGKRLAKYIEKYQDRHPGQPVYLIGHSGGGGVAVFAAESLSKDHAVDRIVLLSPSISADYNLDKALRHTRGGIVNFWSPNDVGVLVLGTSLLGNVDGGHGPAAGAIGFKSDEDSLERSGLHQVEWNPAMEGSGNYGGHTDSAGREFVTSYVAPWILSGYASRGPGAVKWWGNESGF